MFVLQRYILVIVVFIPPSLSKSQDAYFMNTNQSLVYLNPSFSGSSGQVRNQTVYRHQWPDVSGNFVTFLTCTDAYIKELRGGVSLSLFNDDQMRGTLRHSYISVTYAPFFSINDTSIVLIPSLGYSKNMFSLDRGRLNYRDVVNLRFKHTWRSPGTSPIAKKEYDDIEAGLLLKYKHFYTGVACSHILEPDISLFSNEVYRLPIRTTIHGSGYFTTTPRSDIQAYFSMMFQGPYAWHQIRLLSIHRRFFYGLSYSSNTVSALYLGITAKWFTASYSYDAALSKYSGNTAGSHELSCSILFRKKTTTVPELR